MDAGNTSSTVSDINNPKTGESMTIAGVAALALVSAAAVLVVKKRR